MVKETGNPPILLFDGVCNLCNASVAWLLRRDRKGIFRFASLQGETGQELLRERGLDTREFHSVILIVPSQAYYTKSMAAIEIARRLGGLWRVFTVFTWIPDPIRDAVYDFVANNRYRWFGKKEECMLPRPEWKDRFLD